VDKGPFAFKTLNTLRRDPSKGQALRAATPALTRTPATLNATNYEGEAAERSDTSTTAQKGLNPR
jgi:hypothetical protein